MTPPRIVGPVGLALERLAGAASLARAAIVGPAQLGILRLVGAASLARAAIVGPAQLGILRLVGETGAGDAPATGFRLLTEAGDFLTTETGNRLLLE